MNELLRGKKAVVTGGTAGIGKAISLKFAEHRADVAVIGTNQQRGSEIQIEMQRINPDGKFLFIKANVAQKNEVNAGIQTVLQEFGNVDILVNNAGITSDQLLMKMSEEDWDNVMDINVKSCYNLSQALVRHMMKARSGKIINMSSVVGVMGNPGQANYAASKAAVIGFTKALAKELAPRNICVNSIAPGYIRTAMTDSLTEQQKSATVEKIPLGRIGEPEEVANLALFLASSLAGYITGQVFAVDGGMAI